MSKKIRKPRNLRINYIVFNFNDYVIALGKNKVSDFKRLSLWASQCADYLEHQQALKKERRK